ncbi:MAG: hypothetical protein GY822_24750 [Deltaproteobacteria bacterium]|nr:hypothetical protein [Deltaproteobacteria bacterium]
MRAKKAVVTLAKKDVTTTQKWAKKDATLRRATLRRAHMLRQRGTIKKMNAPTKTAKSARTTKKRPRKVNPLRPKNRPRQVIELEKGARTVLFISVDHV